MKFSLMQLIVENSSAGERYLQPRSEHFNSLPDFFHILIDHTYYEISTIKNEEYIWLECDYGSPNPIDPTLTNVDTGEKKDNQRQSDEVELTSQLFVLFHIQKQILYLSDSRKKNLFKTILLDQTNLDFIIKSFYKSKREFIDTIRIVNKISFTEVQDLFNQNSRVRQALIDLTGTDSPERFTLEAKYRNSPNLRTFIENLFQSQSNNELKKLVICGTDESGFDYVFNEDSFTSKIDVSVNKEDTGKFNPEGVREALIAIIYER